MEEGFHTKAGFLGSAQRPCLNELPFQEIGPGKYEVC